MEPNLIDSNMIEKLPPKMAFWAGVITTSGMAFALGFIILLMMMVQNSIF